MTKNLDVLRCADIIKNGGVVAFPTETVYGLGANAFDSSAVSKIFKIKRRPEDNPLIVHISDISELTFVKEINDSARKIIDTFWPGPISLIFDLTSDSQIAHNVTANLSSIAVRMPRNDIARELIRRSGVLIAAPSANISTKPSGTRLEHILTDFSDTSKDNVALDGFLDGGCCEIGLESTVVDVRDEIVKIARIGSITIDEIATVIGREKIDYSDTNIAAKPISPGQKYKHYAPNAPITLVKSANIFTSCEKIVEISETLFEKNTSQKNDFTIGILCSDETLEFLKEKLLFGNFVIISLGNSLEEIGHNFFGTLRKMDELKVSQILSHSLGGNFCAVQNRLEKASTQVVDI